MARRRIIASCPRRPASSARAGAAINGAVTTGSFEGLTGEIEGDRLGGDDIERRVGDGHLDQLEVARGADLHDPADPGHPASIGAVDVVLAEGLHRTGRRLDRRERGVEAVLGEPSLGDDTSLPGARRRGLGRLEPAGRRPSLSSATGPRTPGARRPDRLDRAAAVVGVAGGRRAVVIVSAPQAVGARDTTQAMAATRTSDNVGGATSADAASAAS